MPIRVQHPISLLSAGSAMTSKWVSNTPAHDGARFDACATTELNRLAEAL